MAENETKNSEEQKSEEAAPSTSNDGIKLNSLYAYKMGMSAVFDDSGNSVTVTVLKYEPLIVTQIKTSEKEGYTAVQVGCRPKKAKRTSLAEKGHLKDTSFENGALFRGEVRQELPEGIQVGSKIDINSLSKGDNVVVTGKSKGRGFAGVHKRWNFRGGPATHGSGFGRRPGSIGNRTWPGRVMPGRKMPGHFGDETITIKNLKIVEVIPEDQVVLVSGSVPGSRNSLVKLVKA